MKTTGSWSSALVQKGKRETKFTRDTSADTTVPQYNTTGSSKHMHIKPEKCIKTTSSSVSVTKNATMDQRSKKVNGPVST